MKKLLAVLLSITTLLFVLASCKSDDTKAGGVGAEHKKEKIEVESTQELVEKRLEASKNVKEMSADMSIDFAISAAGEKLDVDIDADVKYDFDGKLMYIDMNAEAMGETMEMEMYMDMGENGATYVLVDDTWVKSSFDEEELAMFEKAYSQENNFDGSAFMINAAHSEEEYDGNKCYKLTYDMDLDLNKILEQTGMSMEDIMGDDYDEMTAAILLMFFESIGDVPVTEYLDVTTLYPVAMEMDMSEMIEDFLATVMDMVISMQYGDEFSAEDLGLEFTVDEALVKVDNMSYSNVTITIPEAALAAEEAVLE